ncbi:MAG TPA: phenylalanine--tRNA ligase subunit beta [Gemmatimonadaceae bacterium]|nr:phenylalanine--tRNA ligase subunit beta [Gemmatimonadaceae bacterium]
MNASYAWLRAMVPTDLTPRALAELLTSRTATVDGLRSLRADLEPIVIARVVECARHPSSDHLSVTRVDAGGDLVDVVCGAPNVRAGAMYPFAPVGTVLPDGMRIEKRKIRGAVSEGMLCSARELRLGDDHEGILELQIDVPTGTPLLQALPLGDTILDVDVTPNRPDLLSHLGLAREIAAARGAPFRLPEFAGNDNGPAPDITRAAREANAGGVRVVLEDAEGCPRYTGVCIRGVTIGPSPEWIADRIRAVGGRPINNVVDATNYLLHELGQPMHAFDAGTLGGAAIVIRRARPGERLTTLDGVARTLEPWMTVIADGDRAQALAGVMGGGDTEVTDRTTDVFLEVAHFDPAGTRRTRRALGLSTDASYRFERGTDPELPPHALARAVSLIRAVAGGRVDGWAVDLHPRPRQPRHIELRTARVAHLLGERLPPDEIRRHLESIGFAIESHRGDTFRVTVPPWRGDVEREVDLIEEVARLHGYDRFSDELRPYRQSTVPTPDTELAARRVREALVAEGLFEARPMPFVTGSDDTHVRVANPLGENEAHLRTSLLETLARRTEFNLALMRRSVRLFEIGAAFGRSSATLPHEELRAAAVILGDRNPPHWKDGPAPVVDEWDAKWLAEVMARAAHPRSEIELEPAGGGSDSEVLWRVMVSGKAKGEVRRLTLDAPPWAAPAYGVEVTLATIPSNPVAPAGQGVAYRDEPVTPHAKGAALAVQFAPLPSTPSAGFDIALLLPNDVAVARVENTIRRGIGPLLERLSLLSEFRGGNVPAGYRSVAWSLTLRHPERTLESREVSGRRDKMLRMLEEELGIKPRTS